eukprot:TRINITY_DN7451_c0_g1_i2.p7 TRINITY_DN7451_c0_g1~~TRINITY_DN7451_c0_g1_i2.p7  ORF type:complete len:117 (+),score=8.65 TRINITY_DN7451_c0_g1_i2:1471-1821(+)
MFLKTISTRCTCSYNTVENCKERIQQFPNTQREYTLQQQQTGTVQTTSKTVKSFFVNSQKNQIEQLPRYHQCKLIHTCNLIFTYRLDLKNYSLGVGAQKVVFFFFFFSLTLGINVA